MKPIWTLVLLLALSGLVPAADALFPELAGWRKDGEAKSFSPANLYEYINGAAENFLAYGFEKLDVQNYVGDRKQGLSAEIYFHGTPENAFGIYGSEKPLAGNYIPAGAEGYEEEGVLNFISGAWYVKLNGFDLGAEGASTLRELAAGIARSLQPLLRGQGLPALLAAFPAAGKVPHSERYIAGNFLGHEFLLPAFTADYELPGKKFRLFIMKADDEEKARSLLRRYAALDKENAAAEIRPGGMIIHDPYNGPVRISWQGVHIWGATGQESEAAGHLAELARNLAGR